MAAKEFVTDELYQDTWNQNLMFGSVMAHILGNARSNLEVWLSYNALRSELVQHSTITLNNISWCYAFGDTGIFLGTC